MRRATLQEEALYTTPVFRTAVSGDVDTFLSGLQLISHSSSRDLICYAVLYHFKKAVRENGKARAIAVPRHSSAWEEGKYFWFVEQDIFIGDRMAVCFDENLIYHVAGRSTLIDSWMIFQL
jgi:hypothetical protein